MEEADCAKVVKKEQCEKKGEKCKKSCAMCEDGGETATSGGEDTTQAAGIENIKITGLIIKLGLGQKK